MSFRNKSIGALSALLSVVLAAGVPLSASATAVLVATIPTTSNPSFVAMSADGTKVFSANYQGTIKTIDTGSNQVLSTGTIAGATNLQNMTSNPVSGLIYALQVSTQAGFPSNVLIVDMTGTAPNVVATVSVGSNAKSMAVSPDGSRLYVGNNGANDNSVSVIDTALNAVVHSIPVPSAPTTAGARLDAPWGMVVSPDNQTLYVSYYDDDVASTTLPGLAKFDTATYSLSTAVEFPTTVHPRGLAISSNGSKLYMANFGTATPSSQWIQMFDMVASPSFGSSTIVPTTAKYPTEIALSADSSTLFVAFAAGTSPAGTFKVYPTSSMFGAETLTLTGATYSTFIAPARANSSHFAYVGSDTNMFLVGEYLSQYRQIISGTIGANLTSTALTGFGFSSSPTYSISPSLPTGFSFDQSTGVISGSSSAAVAQTTFTITGTDGSTSAIATVNLTVTDPNSGGSTASPTATAATSESNTLATTGADVRPVIAMFGLLFVLGVAAIAGTRRNRRTSAK